MSNVTPMPKLVHQPFLLYGSFKDGTSSIMHNGKLILLKELSLKKLGLMSKACSQIMNWRLENKIRMRGVGASEPFSTWISIINKTISTKQKA